MAKNREPVKQVESESESESESGEEDDKGSTGEDDSQESDSESEQTQAAMQNNSAEPQPAAAPPPPPPPQPASSAEEEESGSEAESESEGLNSNDIPVASTRGRSTPTTPLSAKRPAEDTATPSEDAKKTKIDDSEIKSNMFQRRWTEDDEIFLLEGMLDYTNEMKSDPIADLNAFHDFMKAKLHIVFTRAQLQDKIRRLKKKFENNNSKEKEGKEKSFSKPHEQKAYDLSKMIWGDETGSVVRKPPKKKLNLSESKEENDVKNAVVVGGGGGKLSLISGGSSIEEKMLIMGREFFETGLGIEGENEWQKMKVMEWELNLKQLQVRVAQTKLVLGGLKAEDH